MPVAEVAVVVRDDAGRVLLVEEDGGRWSPPSGELERGERPADCAARVVHGRTGVVIEVEALLGAFAGDAAFAERFVVVLGGHGLRGDPGADAGVTFCDLAEAAERPLTGWTEHVLARLVLAPPRSHDPARVWRPG
jgi:ADP-ribose pyrophosphatase YjhB (NUDIX family)